MGKQEIAEERVRILFDLAEKRMSEGEEELANRYVELAWKIATKHTVPIPRDLKKRMCRSCHAYMVPGKNATVRVNSKKNTVNYRCGDCGEVNKYGY